MFKRLLFTTLLLPGLACAQADPGRNAVRELARGNVEAALKELESPATSSPVDEADKHIVRALAASLQEDGVSALREARLAVELGAQPGRFVAGPKEAFSSLYQADGYAEWMSSFGLDLVHGPMIGDVTGTSAKIWLRTDRARTVSIAVSSAGSEKVQDATTLEDTDFTTVVNFDGLQPETAYAVSVRSGEREVGRGAFRTSADQGKPTQFTVIMGGGAGYTPHHERMWATIEGHKPDALFLLGDNVYIDDPTHQFTQDFIYYRRQSRPEWRSLVAKTPIYAIYDDHDFALNDCIPGPFIDQPEWKRPVWETFRNNWVNPYYAGGDAQPGCWFDKHIGDVHFIFLDGRYYRDLSGGTMLGPVQKKWLLENLKHSKGTFKVLVSPVPWSAGVKPRSKDTWDGFPEEREEIFSFVETHGIDGVVLFSADRHRVDVRKTKRENGYDLIDIMSSRLTNVHTHELMKEAQGSEFIMGYNASPAFAKLVFDTQASPPVLTCTIINIDNQPQGEFSVTMDQLRHGK